MEPTEEKPTGNKPTQFGPNRDEPTQQEPTRDEQLVTPILAGPSVPGLQVDSEHMTQSQRRWAFVLGCALIGLLLTAGVLKPNKGGMGTHQQLGLPPCTMVAMFGIRCPSCGMTTSWSHFVRGAFVSSWRANPGGFFLAIVASIAGMWSFVTAFRAVYRPLLSPKAAAIVAMLITAVTLVDWLKRIL